VTEYALRLQNGQDTAARVRMADLFGLTPAGALTARSGIRPAPTAGDVAAQAGTMNVTVQPFAAWVQGGVSAAQGGYVYVLDAAKTLALANGHASLSRTDVVAVVVKDDAYDGSGAYSATVQVVQGTPGAGVPALPANALPLRNVIVPANLSAGTGGLAAGNLSTDRRTYVAGLGGVVTVASQAERDALPATKGTVVYRTDTDTLEGRMSGGWYSLAGPKGAPRGQVTYAQVTTSQGSLVGNGDLTGLAVTFTAETGRRYRVMGHVHLRTDGPDTDTAVRIMEGATVLGQAQARIGSSNPRTVQPLYVGTFSAGSHTLKLNPAFSAGTNTSDCDPTRPAFLLVEDIGAA
jgi:hypothetical protein